LLPGHGSIKATNSHVPSPGRTQEWQIYPANTDGGQTTIDNSAAIFIDHQPEETFGAANIEHQQLLNNVVMPGRFSNDPALLRSALCEDGLIIGGGHKDLLAYEKGYIEFQKTTSSF
jgi:hypothetical protein